MGRTNWRKAEDGFAKGLHNFEVDRLLDKADEASGKKVKKRGDKELSPKQMLIIIHLDLKRLKELNPKIMKALNIDKDELHKLTILATDDPKRLKSKDIKQIQTWLSALSACKSKLSKNLPNEKEMIEMRKKQVYKRHQSRQKWVPLDTHADFKGFKF